jgi:uncharacterized membrane protein YgaE (UPF0421/DUF939 family)
MSYHSFLTGLQLAIRASVAAGLSIAIAYALKLEYPLYAFISAVIVTDLNAAQTRDLGVRRMVASVVGAICGAMLSLVLPAGPIGIGISILSAMLVCLMIGARDGAKVAGYICGIVVLEHSMQPWAYAFHRCLETALGIAIAWGISYVPKLIRLEDGGVDATGDGKPPR